MKKLLLASTALVMSAGVAAADVSVSGDGRMGVIYNSTAVGDKWGFTQRIRIAFNASGTTDSGLTFGGFVRSQDSIPAALGAVGAVAPSISSGAHNVFIAGAFGRLSMGDVAGAALTVSGDLHDVGLTGLNFTNEQTYFHRNFGGGALAGAAPFGNGGPNALYTYSMAGFTFAFSMSQPRGPVDVYGVGIRYQMDGFDIGLGYEHADVPGPSLNHITLGGGYTFGDIAVRAVYGRANNNAQAALGLARKDQFGLSVRGTFDAVTGTIYARRDFANRRHIGIGGIYDLGGGASLRGGVVRRTGAGAPSQTVADFGVNMSF